MSRINRLHAGGNVYTTGCQGGGDKKAGLAPTIQVPINILNTAIYSARPPNCCKINNICYFIPGTRRRQLGGNIIWGGILNRPVQSKRPPYTGLD